MKTKEENNNISAVVSNCTKPLVCGNCEHIDDDSMGMFEHQVCTDGEKEWWCSDCMRQNDLCQNCDAQIWRCSSDDWTDDRLCEECGEQENVVLRHTV